MTTSNAHNETGKAAVHQISLNSITIPAFYHENPTTWFEILESEFAYRNVTPHDHYTILVAALPSTYQDVVSEVSVSAPDRYERLKALILKRTLPTEREAVRGVFRDLQLGSDKPSTLLRKMRQLLGDRKIDDTILKEIWLQKLPPMTQSILAGTSILDLEGLAQVADNVVATSQDMQNHTDINTIRTANSKNASSTDLTLEGLFKQVMTLQKTVELQNRLLRRRSSSRNRSQSRRFRSNSRRKYDICWYHHKFGHQAKRCQPPCKFADNPTTNPGNFNTRT
jgi:hypothetical protein